MGNGLYVHIPFCASKCYYCSFNSYTGMRALYDDYLESLFLESRMLKRLYAPLPVAETVYFGGGNPLLWGSERLIRALEGIRKVFPISSKAEISLETNPEDALKGELIALREAGFNRISIGAQSFDNAVLKGVGRRHNGSQAAQAVDFARDAGFSEVSVDLIYGLPGQSMSVWRQDLAEIIRLRVPHVSVYGLTLEENTPLAGLVATGAVAVAGEDTLARMYELACELLPSGRLELYELSNFAESGHECRHNLNYWRRGDYFGLGAGAHSCRGGLRWWNVSRPDRYIADVRSVAGPEAGREVLEEDKQAAEAAVLALRLRDGINKEAFRAKYGAGFMETREARIGELRSLGLLDAGPDVFLSEKGRLLANVVMEAFV